MIGVLMATSACTRIETGEAGVRVAMDKQVESEELMPGSFNQILFGDVLTFPVKNMEVKVTNMTPLAGDNSTVDDFDMTVIYSINPKSAAEIYASDNRGFHFYDEDSGETFLMYNYVYDLARAAAYKVVYKYESLELNNNRARIEDEIKNEISRKLAENKRKGDITIAQVVARNIQPNKSITSSANQLVVAQNEEKRKKVEVRTAKLEAERIAALNANSGATEYMAAMAMMNISEGIKAGKVQTIIVPADFKALMMNK